jgi:hypothetical protein
MEDTMSETLIVLDREPEDSTLAPRGWHELYLVIDRDGEHRWEMMWCTGGNIYPIGEAWLTVATAKEGVLVLGADDLAEIRATLEPLAARRDVAALREAIDRLDIRGLEACPASLFIGDELRSAWPQHLTLRKAATEAYANAERDGVFIVGDIKEALLNLAEAEARRGRPLSPHQRRALREAGRKV